MNEQLSILEKLGDLKSRGLLSEEEFEKQKQELFGKSEPNKKGWSVWRIVKNLLLWWIVLCMLWVGFGGMAKAFIAQL